MLYAPHARLRAFLYSITRFAQTVSTPPRGVRSPLLLLTTSSPTTNLGARQCEGTTSTPSRQLNGPLSRYTQNPARRARGPGVTATLTYKRERSELEARSSTQTLYTLVGMHMHPPKDMPPTPGFAPWS